MYAMMNEMSKAREAAKKYTVGQLDFVAEAWEDILKCWNIDATNDEELNEAARKTHECKCDWISQAAEEGLIGGEDEFNEILWIVRTLDTRSQAWC